MAEDGKSSNIPFKNHPQFPLLVDVLIRKHKHHAVLQTLFSTRMILPFLHALIAHISHDHIPHHLRHTELILLDEINETNLTTILNQLNQSNNYLLLAIHSNHSLDYLKLALDKLIAHSKCRILILTNHDESHYDDCFAEIAIAKPADTDILALLKQQKAELENFHHVLIPDEILIEAYQLAERYLSTQDALDQALLLLDSSAARAAVYEQANQHSAIKPALTSATLLQVLASWTSIPVSHLPLNTFHASEFSHALQQKIIGQDMAIALLAQKLQQAYARVQEIGGPFSTFLFAGERYTGKKSTASMLAEQLFNRRDALYVASLSPACTSLLELKLQRRSDFQFLSLKKIIRQTPYAILFLENIEQAPSELINELIDALSTGTLHDTDGTHYYLHQSILLLSTTTGADRLAELVKPAAHEEKSSQIDLMQFILQQKQATHDGHCQLTAHEIAQELQQALVTSLPAALCQRAHIIPFIPLTQSVVDQIIRLKLKLLGKQLDSRFGIDLGYAPEIIRFLADEALSKEKSGNIDSAIKQLYLSIEQTILEQEHNPHRPNQLFLQLNETGQVLRCHWLTGTAREHAT